jgi:hypothetical protein
MKSRFQRRMARQSRKQQRRRQERQTIVPYTRFPPEQPQSAFSFMNEQAGPYRSPQSPLTNLLDQDIFGQATPSRFPQFRRNVENQTEGGPGTRGDGSLCSGMNEDNCKASSFACTWETRSDTGTSFCKRRSHGAEQGRLAKSLVDVEAREEARLREAREQYKADAEMRRLFEAEAAPAPMPGSYGSYVPPSMPYLPTMGSRSVPPPPSMPYLPTMGSRSVPPFMPVSPPVATKKSKTAAKKQPEPEPETSTINLHTLTMDELRALAEKYNVSIAPSNKRETIIKKISDKLA